MIPDLSVLWVIFIVLTLTLIVHALTFTPILTVTRERTGALDHARVLAADTESRAAVAAARITAGVDNARPWLQADAPMRSRGIVDPCPGSPSVLEA